jgi:membrane fusion protein, macrolide-specific efflux system
MSADVTVVVAAAENVVAVPASALSGTSGSYTVRVLGSDGTATTTPVEVGLVTSDLAEITGGVSAGDTVVTGTAADQAAATSSSSSSGGVGDMGGLSGAGGMPAGGPPAGMPAPGGN